MSTDSVNNGSNDNLQTEEDLVRYGRQNGLERDQLKQTRIEFIKGGVIAAITYVVNVVRNTAG